MRQEVWMEYLEPDEADLLEAEALLWEDMGETRGAADSGTNLQLQSIRSAKDSRKHLSGKRWLVLLAACMLTFGIAAVAASQNRNGWLSSYLQVSDKKEEELLWQMAAEVGASAEDAGYRIEVTECASDGNRIYALLTVTAPEDTTLDDRQYALEGMPWKVVEESLGGADFLAGGGYIEDVDRPAQNQAAFLLVWDVNDPVRGKEVVLKITGIKAYADDGSETVVAQGQWELMLQIPEMKTKAVRQWTKTEAGEDTYYVHEVELTPLGIRIKAVKAVQFFTLWKTAEYAVQKSVLRQNPAMPEGWSKEAFYELPVTVVYQDGSQEKITLQDNGSSGFSCEKSVIFEKKRIVDPGEIMEIRLGETVLKTR